MADLYEMSVEDLPTACPLAEAQVEPETAQQAVCNVLLNRVKKRTSPSIRDVILKPNQFSWTNPDDVNFQKVFTAKTDSQDSWARAAKLAEMALAKTLRGSQ